jgi:T-complex protein 1 subunit theta
MKDGTKSYSGLEQAVLRNIEACTGLAEITRTSFGPNGMNKMLINHLEKMFVTSDTATIVKELEIEHPAAKMIILASNMQESEIGDGSNYVITVAGALLRCAAELIKMGLHPSEIIAGYTKAGKKALEILEDLTVWTVEKKDFRDEALLARAMRSAICAKQFGCEDILAPLIAKACLTVLPKNVYNFNVDNVRVCKILGGSLEQSTVIKGMVLKGETQGNPDITEFKNAKIAVFTCSLEPAETETKGTVLIETAEQLMAYNKSEEKEIEEMIRGFKASGISVVVTGGSINDMAQHFLAKFDMMAIKVSSKFELRRLCRAIRARPLVALGAVRQEDAGFASRVRVEIVGMTKICVFEQEEVDDASVATVLLRASTHNILNDVERAVDDGVNIVKAMGKNAPCHFIAGGGAADIEIARRLLDVGAKSTGLDQYAIKKFGEALEVIPRTLAENAGQDGMAQIAKLYAAHESGKINMGINIDTTGDGALIDMVENSVLDLAITKKQALILATDAVVTILRVDQIIQAKKAGGPKLPKNGHWDDTDI